MSMLHQTWTDKWAPTLLDDGLRAELINSTRFVTRIEHDLLDEFFEHEGDLESLERDNENIQARVDQIGDEALLRAGLFWFGPVLANSLQPLANLTNVSPNRTRVQMVLDGRNHNAASLVKHPRGAEDLLAAGQLCLTVWLRFQSPELASRLELRLGLELDKTLTDSLADGARYAAMTAALDTMSEDTA